jgi:hypothetical protein
MRRPPWKLIGLAGLAGVAATGAVVARNRRAHAAYDPDELRDRLHRRLAEAAQNGSGDAPADGSAPGDGPSPANGPAPAA